MILMVTMDMKIEKLVSDTLKRLEDISKTEGEDIGDVYNWLTDGLDHKFLKNESFSIVGLLGTDMKIKKLVSDTSKELKDISKTEGENIDDVYQWLIDGLDDEFLKIEIPSLCRIK